MPLHLLYDRIATILAVGHSPGDGQLVLPAGYRPDFSPTAGSPAYLTVAHWNAIDPYGRVVDPDGVVDFEVTARTGDTLTVAVKSGQTDQAFPAGSKVLGLILAAHINERDGSGGGGASLPDQTGNSGKVLSTDGTDASWLALSISNVTGLQSALDGKAAAVHTHAIGDVTGLQAALDGKAALVHSHTAADVTDFPEAVDDRVAALLVQGTGVSLTYDDTAGTLTVAAALTTTNVAEGTNLYYTDVRADARADARIAAQAGQVNGLATLDAGGKIPSAQIPAVAISDFLGTVASQSALLALTGQRGDWAIRSDLGATYILTDDDASVLANWQAVQTPADAVQSVNGQTGTVSLTTTDVGEGTRLYYTDVRADARVTAGITSAIGLTIQAHDLDLDALASLSGTGFARRTGSNTWTVGSLSTGDIPDLSATYQPLGADLTAIEALTSTGVLQRTGANTWAVAALVAADIPSLDAAKITTGVFSTALLGTGTANSTVFLRGDGAWAAATAAPVPAGSDTQVQFNDAGATGASANFTYDKVAQQLFVKGAGNAGSTTMILGKDSNGNVRFRVNDNGNVKLGAIDGANGDGLIFQVGGVERGRIANAGTFGFGASSNPTTAQEVIILADQTTMDSLCLKAKASQTGRLVRVRDSSGTDLGTGIDVNGFIIALSTSGAPSGTPADCAIAVDPAASKLWVRCGGAWKSVTLT